MIVIRKSDLFNALAKAQDKGEIFAIIQAFPGLEITMCGDCEYYGASRGECCRVNADPYERPSVEFYDFCSCAVRREVRDGQK